MEKIFEEFLSDLKDLISIRSVLGDEKNNAPFGTEINKALDKTLEISKKLGFKTYKDPAGYYGYADIGSGNEMIGILGHIDVVPEGDLEKWNTKPYDLIQIEDKLYGRGTQDDKGPVLIAMYAVKKLIDDGYKFNKKIRFIFGTDEENLWRGITKYTDKEQIPHYGFTPDSKFPLIYAEKGLLQCKLKSKKSSQVILEGGDAYNSVPSKITYTAKNNEEANNICMKLDAHRFEYEIKDLEITVMGKAMHAASADKGVNAISRLCIVLDEMNFKSNVIKFMASEVKENANGKYIFGDVQDTDTGKLMFNIGKIKLDEDEELNVDMRMPICIEKDEVISKLTEVASKYNLEVIEYDYLRPVRVEKKSKLVKVLMEAYREVTNDLISEPEASGGATYARALDNCVAYGIVFPDSAKTEHQPNEYVTVKDVTRSYDVYLKAIKKLNEEDMTNE